MAECCFITSDDDINVQAFRSCTNEIIFKVRLVGISGIDAVNRRTISYRADCHNGLDCHAHSVTPKSFGANIVQIFQ